MPCAGRWAGRSRKWVAHHGPGQEYDLDSGVFAGVWERATLLEYGGWDEHWVRNQDSEMAGRFLARGESLKLIPEMAAAYVPRDSLPGLARQYHGYGRYRMKTAVRHPHTMRRSHLLAPGGRERTLATAVVGPRPLRPARAGGVGGYVAALAVRRGSGARREPSGPADAATVPAALAAMHLGWGTGALREALRRGPPWRRRWLAGSRRLPSAWRRRPSAFCALARARTGRADVWAPPPDERAGRNQLTCWPRA